ncbi:MAG: PAS domain-containing protein [Maribacter sp.]
MEKGINFYKKGYHRDKITEIVSTAIEKGKPWDTELIIVTAKGNEVWVRAKGEVEMVNNKATRIIGTFQDINKTKKAELEYKKVSERLQIATNTAKIGIWDYDIEQNQLVWDANMFELYGIREDDFAGVFEAWQAGVHPDDLERGNLEIQNAISNKKKFDTEFRVLWPNGQIRNIRAIARSIKDSNGKTIKLVGANWDITEMKTTRLQLARSIESFEETFENVAIGMAVVSPDFKFIKINKSLTYSLGYSEKELLKLKTLDITHPEDIFKTKELYEKAYEGKEDTYQIEKRYFHKTGYIVHVILVITVVKEINGQPLHAIAQFLDITDRIEAEKKSKLLVEVTKEQNDSLINFAHIVSHNLRSHSTNLNMLTSFLNLEKDEAEREHINTMITKAAESLSETIAHLNDVVQARTGTLENLTSVNVLSTIEQIKNSIGGLLEEQGAELYIEVSKFHFVNAVPAYLESIFLNILTNSLKYKAPDRAPKIKIKSISKENKIGVSFADNGQGIDLERHGDKIFGMYKTFHKHKDAKGIGLFITKNQIEAMNGSIQIESKVNLGTTLLIELQKG